MIPSLPSPRRRRSPTKGSGRRRLAPWLLAFLTGAAALGLAPSASAETVMERVARTGELVLAGGADVPPLLYLNDKGQPVGYSMDVAQRIAAELSAATGKPVRVRFRAIPELPALLAAVGSAEVDLSCGIPFTWDREMTVDNTLPFALSGVRVLTAAGRLDGSPASLRGRRVGVMSGSLGETVLEGVQPGAVAKTYPTLVEAVAALKAGTLDGVIGDSHLLEGLQHTKGLSGYALVPEFPYVRYAVGCIVPENNSSFANVVNLAIARLVQGYLDGRPDAVAIVDRWAGPGSMLGVPAEKIRAYFETILLNREGVYLSAPSQAPASTPSGPGG